MARAHSTSNHLAVSLESSSSSSSASVFFIHFYHYQQNKNSCLIEDILLEMCEETQHYLWALQDILGRGATSQVYKAYNKSTGELVAAKVYQGTSSSRSAPGDGKANQNRDYRPILERELDILKSANHENIVRYIALEPVISSDATPPSGDQEALLIEYCNGGSLNNVLELPENRYGLIEDDFMLLFRQLTNALRYLHDKNTVSTKLERERSIYTVLFRFIVILNQIISCCRLISMANERTNSRIWV
jgi:serine/threonine protein kinase